jgi:hypothetical protein
MEFPKEEEAQDAGGLSSSESDADDDNVADNVDGGNGGAVGWRAAGDSV